MIKFHSVGQIEHGIFKFEDAVTVSDTYNGAFGDVSDGKFTVGATKSKAIMQVEVGDDAGLAQYPIAKNTHVRVVDLGSAVGEKIEIYDYPLPATVAVGNKLESDTDGSLKVNASPTGIYLEVIEIIGNHQGVVAVITDGAE